MNDQHGFILAACNANIGLTRFARAVHNAAHHGHLDGLFIALQALFHFLGNFNARILCAAAGGAADHLGACHRKAGGAQDIVSGLHLTLGVIGQRNTQRIANALQQHTADAHAGFDQAHAIGSGFGNAHMQRIIALLAQQPVRFHHAGHIAAFDGDHDLIKIVFFQKRHMIHGAFHQCLGHGCAVFFQNMLFQTARIHTNANGHAVQAAGIGHGLYTVVTANVAGVDADLIHARFHTGQRRLIVKMDIRHNGNIHGVFQRRDQAGILGGGHGNAQDLAACRRHTLCLLHIALHILYRHIQHGLHCNGMVAANGQIADLHFPFRNTHSFSLTFSKLKDP